MIFPTSNETSSWASASELSKYYLRPVVFNDSRAKVRLSTLKHFFWSKQHANHMNKQIISNTRSQLPSLKKLKDKIGKSICVCCDLIEKNPLLKPTYFRYSSFFSSNWLNMYATMIKTKYLNESILFISSNWLNMYATKLKTKYLNVWIQKIKTFQTYKKWIH